jgi:hypothetical protein
MLLRALDAKAEALMRAEAKITALNMMMGWERIMWIM